MQRSFNGLIIRLDWSHISLRPVRCTSSLRTSPCKLNWVTSHENRLWASSVGAGASELSAKGQAGSRFRSAGPRVSVTNTQLFLAEQMRHKQGISKRAWLGPRNLFTAGTGLDQTQSHSLLSPCDSQRAWSTGEFMAKQAANLHRHPSEESYPSGSSSRISVWILRRMAVCEGTRHCLLLSRL